MRASALLFLAEAMVLLTSIAPPATPPKSASIFPPITQPDNPSPPAPKPVPGSVPVLSGDVIYVVSQEDPFLLFASPPGLVSVTRETGPLRIRAKFLDGTGKVETRTYSGKHIAIIEATGKGKVELIAVPTGATDEGAAQRMLIEANNGAQPPPDDDKKEVIPPPKPKPPPIDDKKDDPAPDLIDGPVWLVTVTGPKRSIAAAKVVNNTAFWKGLEKAGHSFRHYSPTDASAIEGKYTKMFNEVGGDCLIIVKPDPNNPKSGTVVKKVKLPASTADVEAILKGVVK